MTNKHRFKAVIFDFDGVIVESMGIKENAFIDLFKDYPEHIAEIVKLHREHGGLSRFEKFKIIYRDILNLPYTKGLEKKLGKKFEKFVYNAVIKCPFVPGANEFLEKYHKKLALFIVSGTPELEMRRICKDRGIAKFFTEIFGSPEKKGALCLKILKKYHLSPAEVIMIGDSIDDYEGAKEAKINFIGRLTSADSIFCKRKSARLITGAIRDLRELEKFVSQPTK